MMVGEPSRTEILEAIIRSVVAVAPDVRHVDATTQLLGPNAILDSVGFITLLIAIEQNLNGSVDLSSSLMAEDAVPEAENPFLTVGSLTDHIGQLVSRA
jgi:hypothetical protein